MTYGTQATANEFPSGGRVCRICFSLARGWYVRGGSEREQAEAQAWLDMSGLSEERAAA